MAVNYHAWHIDKPICSPCGERALSYSKRHGGGVDGVINRQRRETQGKWWKQTTKKREKRWDIEKDIKRLILWHIPLDVVALWIAISVCQLPGPPLLSRLKYLNNNWIDCHKILYSRSWSPDDESCCTDFGDLLTFPFVPPWGWHLWFWVNCLENYLTNYYEIWYWHLQTDYKPFSPALSLSKF